MDPWEGCRECREWSSLEAVVSSVGSGGASAVPDGLGEDEMGDATAGLGDLPPAFLATLASASFCWRSASICRKPSSMRID